MLLAPQKARPGISWRRTYHTPHPPSPVLCDGRKDSDSDSGSTQGIALNFTALFQRSCGKDGSGSLCIPISDVPPQRVLRPQVSLTKGWVGLGFGFGVGGICVDMRQLSMDGWVEEARHCIVSTREGRLFDNPVLSPRCRPHCFEL